MIAKGCSNIGNCIAAATLVLMACGGVLAQPANTIAAGRNDEWYAFRASVLATVAAQRTASGVAGPEPNDALQSGAGLCAAG
jgi:hypothetical protein